MIRHSNKKKELQVWFTGNRFLWRKRKNAFECTCCLYRNQRWRSEREIQL